jgi:hypothetical protein
MVPTFHLSANSSANQVLGTPILARLNGTWAEVDNSGPGLVATCGGRARLSFSAMWQFYVTGSQPALLQARVFQKIPGLRFFENRCVVLQLLELQLPKGDGDVINHVVS